MRNWSKAFMTALDAIIPDEPLCTASNHRFGIGQPVWMLPDHAYGNHTAFICTRFYTGVFGDWLVEMVAENDIEGDLYCAPESHLTDEPPILHPEHGGVMYATATGRAVKSISGGVR